MIILKEFSEKVDFEKADDKKIMKNYPACKELMLLFYVVYFRDL